MTVHPEKGAGAGMKSDLGLDSDGDDVEIVMDVEAAFGVKFPNDELEQIYTVGEMHDALLRRFEDGKDPAEICFSAHTFYRLRRALTPFLGKARPEPNSPIKSLLKGQPPHRIVAEIESETGLKLPPLGSGIIQYFAGLLVFISLLAPIVVYEATSWPPGIGLLLVPVIFLSGWKLGEVQIGKVFSPSYADMKTLTRTVMKLNIGRLAEKHGNPGEKILWQSLTAILADFTGLKETEIGRETRFFPA